MKLSRCRAALAGRDFVTPDDVKAVAVPALAHRLMLRPELWVQRLSGEDVVRDVLESVPTPPAEDPAAAARRRRGCTAPRCSRRSG
jgi:MoxR-like ATPase